MPNSRDYFATCPRGLEAELAAELRSLGAREARESRAGVSFAGDVALAYRVNLESRLASRVLMQLSCTTYRNEQDVYDAAMAVPWPKCFDVSRSIRVDATAIRSPLKSLDFITLRIKDAICDRFRGVTGARPDVDTRRPEVRIMAFFDPRQVTLYLDTSGEPLHKRGYRREPGEAPLKENLAAGILKLAGWRPGEPLLDPMCGSGTFLVEAALMAADLPPGANRHFGFERLNDFDAETWRQLRRAALEQRVASSGCAIFGSDASAREIAKARANLAAAGLEELVRLKQVDVLEVRAPAPEGVLIANPPYGVRTENAAKLAAFYPRLGDTLKARFAGWRCYLFSADRELPRLIRLRASRRTPLFNGPLECRLYEYLMVSGDMRKRRPGEEIGDRR